MTRSEKISKRKAFNKDVRAYAAQQQIAFVSVLKQTMIIQNTPSYRATMSLPSHQTKAAKRVGINKQSVEECCIGDDMGDDDELELQRELNDGGGGGGGDGVLGRVNGEGKREDSRSTFVVDLMGMAKPAKPKGVAKEYEVVGKVRKVIALEDDDDHSFDEYDADGDEWEEVDFDYVMNGGGPSMKRSYSAALRGR